MRGALWTGRARSHQILINGDAAISIRFGVATPCVAHCIPNIARSIPIILLPPLSYYPYLTRARLMACQTTLSTGL